MRTCPMCSNEAADDATACICGYTFQAKADGGAVEPSARRQAKAEIATWGWGLLVAGIALAVGSQFMSTAVESYSSFGSDGVHNIGLMQQQMMVFQAGLTAALGGVVCLAAGAIIDRR